MMWWLDDCFGDIALRYVVWLNESMYEWWLYNVTTVMQKTKLKWNGYGWFDETILGLLHDDLWLDE